MCILGTTVVLKGDTELKISRAALNLRIRIGSLDLTDYESDINTLRVAVLLLITLYKQGLRLEYKRHFKNERYIEVMISARVRSLDVVDYKSNTNNPRVAALLIATFYVSF